MTPIRLTDYFETHNVDKSLEGKLKCLNFIPIISQTYCDPKSFAWQHEFLAFNKLAKEDRFGRDIKLSNGNVASRILPVKIHDLDAEDKTLLLPCFGWRPFGATFGDVLTKTPEKGGLGFGTKGSSLILFTILAALIVYETRRKQIEGKK